MKYYLVDQPESVRRGAGRFLGEAVHRWCLPGVECGECNATWASRGFQYPSLDLGHLDNEAALLCNRKIGLTANWPEFEMLRAPVLSLLEGRPVPPPGTSFGPSIGRVVSYSGDFAWPNSWTPLVNSRAFGALSAESEFGDLRFMKCDFQYVSDKPLEELYEPEILPLVFLELEIGARKMNPCRVCGRRGFSRPRNVPLNLDKSSIPTNGHIFRIVDLPTYIVCDEIFKNFIEQKTISNVEFAEIGVS